MRKCILRWNSAVAHGISTTIEGKKTIIGSYHFVFEDENCRIPQGMEGKIPSASTGIFPPLSGGRRQPGGGDLYRGSSAGGSGADAIEMLRRAGISKIVMMTGDSEQTAAAVAARVGVGRILFRGPAGG